MGRARDPDLPRKGDRFYHLTMKKAGQPVLCVVTSVGRRMVWYRPDGCEGSIRSCHLDAFKEVCTWRSWVQMANSV